MSPKTLEPTSDYAKYDVDGDGIVSDEELKAVAKLEELEMQEEKADAQRRMAWVSLISMLVFTGFVFLPIFPDSRIQALADLFGLFYIGTVSYTHLTLPTTPYV